MATWATCWLIWGKCILYLGVFGGHEASLSIFRFLKSFAQEIRSGMQNHKRERERERNKKYAWILVSRFLAQLGVT